MNDKKPKDPFSTRVALMLRKVLPREWGIRLHAWTWNRYFDRQTAGLDRVKDSARLEEIDRETYITYVEFDEDLRILRSQKLVDQARRLQLPVPPLRVPLPEDEIHWDQGRINPQNFLTDEGTVAMRRLIRAELKSGGRPLRSG